MNKVAIYCRLSDEDKDKANKHDESESIQNQKNLLTKYAVEQNWDIYKIYSDDDYSGMDERRPEFNQMIIDAEQKKFDIVLCKHQSRFTRDLEMVEKYLHRKFPEWGIRFVSVTDNVDTKDKGNKKARQINSLVNEWYCDDISEAVRATFKTKREDGKFIGSFAPFGYRKDEWDNNKLVIDEDAAKIVRMIFKWYLEGYGTQKIAYMLNEKGIPNPTKYKQDRGLKYKNPSQTDSYGLWNKTTIRRMLRDETYIGHLVQGKREKINYKLDVILNKPKDEWIVVKDTHEPIIERDHFYAVQRRLNSHIRSSGDGKAHIFAGKIKCLNCRSSMNKVRSSKDYAYLRCKLYAKAPGNRLCTSHSIRLDKLEEVISDKIRGYFSMINLGSLIDRLRQNDLFFKRIDTLERELSAVEKQIREKDNIMKNLYADKVKGMISSVQFYQLNNTFIHDKGELTKRKKSIEKEMMDIKDRFNHTEGWIEVILKYKDFKKLTPAMINTFVDCIEIGEVDKNNEKKIVIHWNF